MFARFFRTALPCNLLFSLLLIATLPRPAFADDHGLSHPEQVEKALRQWQATQVRASAAQLQNVARSDGGITADLHLNALPEKKLHLIITARPHDGNAHGGTLLPSLLLLTDPRSPDAVFAPAVASLVAALTHLDTGQLGEKNRNPGGLPPPDLVKITLIALLLSLLVLPRVLRQAWRFLSEDQPTQRLFFVILLAFVLRALSPHRLVMVYFGYLHFDDAVYLQHLPRYGPATTVLDHMWFAALQWLTGEQPRIQWQQWLHVILGTLTLLPLAALAQRLFNLRHAGLMAMILLAILPLSLLDHGSESMLVPALFWWSCGALALQEFEQTREDKDLLCAIVMLGLCGLSRPDAMLVGPLTAILLMKKPQAHLRRLGAMLLFLLALWFLDIEFLRERTAEDLAQGNLPHLQWQFLIELPQRLWHGWVVLEPRYFPIILTFLAAIALLFSSLRAAALRLWLVAIVWALPMLLDFNETSMLRLHAPSAMLVVLIAAGTIAELLDRQAQVYGVALRLPILFNCAWTVGDVFAVQNSTVDQHFFDIVSAHSRDERQATYVMRGYDDLPDQGIHLFAAQALLEPRDRWLSVGEYLRDPAAVHQRGSVYVVQNLRCYAGLPEQRRKFAAHIHPACTSLCGSGRCRPIFADWVVDRGERGFDWYAPGPDSPLLEISLSELSSK